MTVYCSCFSKKEWWNTSDYFSSYILGIQRKPNTKLLVQLQNSIDTYMTVHFPGSEQALQ